MASNTANQLTVMTALQTLIQNIESFSASWRSGAPDIDNITVMLMTTRLDGVMSVLLNQGSRAQQLATSQAHAANNNVGAGVAADIQYKIVDDYMRALAAQIFNLQNPSATPRRSQPTLQ